MSAIKILNLYAGVGGNCKLWRRGDDLDVTAVELEPKIAAVYSRLYPQDTVVVADAHQFLLDHFGEFDFVWSSPPCQTHSRMYARRRARGECYVYMFLLEPENDVKQKKDAAGTIDWVLGRDTPFLKRIPVTDKLIAECKATSSANELARDSETGVA